MGEMAGSDSDSTDSEEMEEFGPLHEAASMGRMDTCKYLVEDLGFDINAEANNDSGLCMLSQVVKCYIKCYCCSAGLL